MKGPVVVALMGLPGAGKSTLARGLRDALGWTVVDRDALRAGLFPQARGTAEEKEAANRAVFAAISECLQRGQSCLVDGMSFAARVQREELRRLAHDAKARCWMLWLDCPMEIAAARVAAQTGHPAVDRAPALVREVAARFDSATEPGSIRLDANWPADVVLGTALKALKANPPVPL